ncbi:MAG: hypothetical protein AMXMBFR57_04620 [Acidimicrobiia bacterium]
MLPEACEGFCSGRQQRGPPGAEVATLELRICLVDDGDDVGPFSAEGMEEAAGDLVRQVVPGPGGHTLGRDRLTALFDQVGGFGEVAEPTAVCDESV